MTEKLYEQDSMLKSCLATVLSCAEDKRNCELSQKTRLYNERRGFPFPTKSANIFSSLVRTYALAVSFDCLMRFFRI